MYARAKEQQAHVHAEDALDIADERSGDVLKVTEDGETRWDYENINRSKLRVDTRKWFAAKLLPKVYGDKTLHVGGDGEGPVVHKMSLDWAALDAEELLQFRALLEKATVRRGPTIDAEAEDGEE